MQRGWVVGGWVFLLMGAGAIPPAAAADSCATDDDCIEDGQCTPVDGDCEVVSYDDCRHAEICTIHGRCTPRDGRCVATSVDACFYSKGCRDDGDCALNREDAKCDDGIVMLSKPTFFVGVGLLGGGVLATALGLLFYSAGGGDEPLGPGLAVGGGVGAVLGTALMVVGGQAQIRSEAPLTLQLGPTGVGLQYRF